MKMRSPIRWFGGKGNFTQHLLPLIPDHKCYVEVFGGGASLLFAKPPSKVEVYNDIDGDVVAFFRIFHDPEAMEVFKRKCFYTPYSRDIYFEYRDTWREQTDPIERVYRWFIVSRMSFNADPEKRNGVSMVDSRVSRAGVLKGYVDNFDAYVERLRMVAIEKHSWEYILESYDSANTLFYVDPPYLPDTRISGSYEHEMTLADHQHLVDALAKLQGRVLLSGYPNELYDALGWHRDDIEFYAPTANGNSRRHEARRTECLWHNYEIQPTLF